MLLEPKDFSPSREDAPCNSLGASMTWLPPETPSKPKVEKIQFCEALRQIWATLAVHCMVILVGMTLGFSAILIPQLEEADSDISINIVDASWLASIISIVAPIGSLSSGPVVQWLGSKKTIRLSLIPYAVGWLLISFANGLPMLLAGRLITGLATMDTSSTPEKAKGLMKGLDTSRISEVSDQDLEDEDDDSACRRKKAEQTYAFLVDEHERIIKKQMQENFGNDSGVEGNLLGSIPKSSSPTGSRRKRRGLMRRLEILFTHPTGWKPLLMLTIIFVFQQYAGVYITLFYAVNVFKEMGGGALDEYIASILVGVVRFFMSLVNIWLFRKFGRRPLITLSAVGMFICMLTSGSVLQYTQQRQAALEKNLFNPNGTLDPLNWSTIESPNVTPELLLNVTQGDQYLNDAPNGNNRFVRSLDDPSPEYLSANNLLGGNLSSDALSDLKLTSKNDKNFTVSSINGEERIEKTFDIYDKNNLLFNGYNMSDSMMAVTEETVIEPPRDALFTFINAIPTICMLLYVCVSMVGFLAIPWTITAELFPTEIRSLANSIILSVANMLLFSALQAYPHMLDFLGPAGVLYLFAAVSAGGGVFVYFFLPETHGRNLKDIEQYFAENTVYTYPCKK